MSQDEPPPYVVVAATPEEAARLADTHHLPSYEYVAGDSWVIYDRYAWKQRLSSD